MRADNVLPGGDDVLKGSLGRAVPPRPSRFRLWFVLFYTNNQVVFQINITETDILKKNFGIANLNCSSQALRVFLRLPSQKDTLFKTLNSKILYPV